MCFSVTAKATSWEMQRIEAFDFSFLTFPHSLCSESYPGVVWWPLSRVSSVILNDTCDCSSHALIFSWQNCWWVNRKAAFYTPCKFNFILRTPKDTLWLSFSHLSNQSYSCLYWKGILLLRWGGGKGETSHVEILYIAAIF